MLSRFFLFVFLQLINLAFTMAHQFRRLYVNAKTLGEGSVRHLVPKQ